VNEQEISFTPEGRRINLLKEKRHDQTNKAGLTIPSTPKLNAKYYQETAPEVAMDRAEIVSVSETCTIPAGAFRSA
jgi:hypothetical protein